MSNGAIGDLYFHVHHEVLAEFLTEPLANRIAYIKAEKPEREVPIRLTWMTPVLGEVPASLVKAWAAYDKARAAYAKAFAAYDRARAAYAYAEARAAYADEAWAAAAKARAATAYDKALAAARPALETLHAIEHPGCPYRDGTLFPKEPPAGIAR